MGGSKGGIGVKNTNIVLILTKIVSREKDVYEEYKKLGGKKSKNLFLDEHDVFLDETLDIFVFGDMTKHKSRDDALDSVIDITNMSEKELNLHFKAEDNLGGYT